MAMTRKSVNEKDSLGGPLHAVTHSAVSTWLKCEQRYVFRYLLNLEPRRLAAPLVIGSAFHAAVEHYFKHPAPINDDPDGEKMQAGEVAAMAYIQRSFGDPELEAGSTDMDTVISTALATFKGWVCNLEDTLAAGSDRLYDSPAALREVTFHPVEGGESVLDRMAGKVDNVIPLSTEVEDGHDGIPAEIEDYKTRQSLSMFAWANTVNINKQLLWYVRLMQTRRPEYDVRRVTLNLIVKPQHRTPRDFHGLINRKMEAMLDDPAKYFGSASAEVCAETMAYFDMQLAAIVERMDNIEPKSVIQNTSACEMPSACPYISLCRNEARMDDLSTLYSIDTLKSTFYTKAAHSELADKETS